MKLSRIITVLMVIALSGLAYAGFTASNTLPSTSIGSGSGTISGYAVSSVAYRHNASNPSNVDEVDFTLTPAAANYVKIRLTACHWPMVHLHKYGWLSRLCHDVAAGHFGLA